MSDRYPLSMHKGEWPNIQSEYVYDAEGEKALAERGYSRQAPYVPDIPEPAMLGRRNDAPDLTPLLDRIAALESAVEELRVKRGPGRPAKESK